MNIRPLQDRIIVKRIQEEEKTAEKEKAEDEPKTQKA